MAYKLSKVIEVHADDAILDWSTVDNTSKNIISCSRDGTVIIWKETDESAQVDMSFHLDTVCCVCYVHPNSIFQSGLICAGGTNNTISIFEFGEMKAMHTLQSHLGPVSRLAAGPYEDSFTSASWDCHVIAWKLIDKSRTPEVGFDLKFPSVCTAICHDKDNVCLGFFDGKIEILDINGAIKMKLLGHVECVRDIIAETIANNTILSCSNDGTIRKWSTDSGQCLEILANRCNFIFSLSIRNGVISFGEESGLCIMKNNYDVQYVAMPFRSVSKILFTSDTDIITGCSDGKIRKFSSDPSNQAPDEKIKSLDPDFNMEEKKICGRIISSYPDSILSITSTETSDGALTLINENKEITCYQRQGKNWIKLGTVMNDNGIQAEVSGRMFLPGIDCDYILILFNEDSKSFSKVPFNLPNTDSTEENEEQSSTGKRSADSLEYPKAPPAKKFKLSEACDLDLQRRKKKAYSEAIQNIEETFNKLDPVDQRGIEVLLKTLISEKLNKEVMVETLRSREIKNQIDIDIQKKLTSIVYSRCVLEKIKNILLKALEDCMPPNLTESKKLKFAWQVLFKLPTIDTLTTLEKVISEERLSYPEIDREVERIKKSGNPKVTFMSWFAKRSTELYFKLCDKVRNLEKLNWIVEKKELYSLLVNMRNPKPSDLALISILQVALNRLS